MLDPEPSGHDNRAYLGLIQGFPRGPAVGAHEPPDAELRPPEVTCHRDHDVDQFAAVDLLEDRAPRGARGFSIVLESK